MSRKIKSIVIDGEVFAAEGPDWFARKPRRDGPTEHIRALVTRESPDQRDARFKAYSDPIPEVTPGKPVFFQHVTGGYSPRRAK